MFFFVWEGEHFAVCLCGGSVWWQYNIGCEIWNPAALDVIYNRTPCSINPELDYT